MQQLSFDTQREFENNINFIIKRKMGNGIFISNKIAIDSDTSNYILGAYVPKLIEDMKLNERKLKFLRFNKVSTIEVNKDGSRVVALFGKRDDLCDEIYNKISSLIFSVENALLDNVYENLVKIPLVQTSLNPIKEIFINIHKVGFVTLNQLEKGRKPEKVRRYVKLLEDLDFIRIEGDKYVEGNKMVAVREMISEQDYKSIYNKLLSIVIQQGYGYIRKYMNIMSITPYLRWITSYYYPALQYSGLINLNDKAMTGYYKEIYNISQNPIRARNQINHVIDADVLEREGSYIVGKEETFDQLAKQIHF